MNQSVEKWLEAYWRQRGHHCYNHWRRVGKGRFICGKCGKTMTVLDDTTKEKP